MRPCPRFALLLPILLLAGCAVPPVSNSGPVQPGNVAALAGDWLVLPPLGSGLGSQPVLEALGALQVNGNAITGIFRAISLTLPQCVLSDQDLSVSGTYAADGTLTLTIPISGGTATIMGNVSTPETYNPATLAISGGSCAMPSTPMQIAQFAPMTGTYVGTMTGSSGVTGLSATISVTAVLTQSTLPNADGQFPIAGTVSYTGNCTGSFTIAGTVVSGGILGPTGVSNGAFLMGGEIPSGTLFAGDIIAPTCPYGFYGSNLNRQ